MSAQVTGVVPKYVGIEYVRSGNSMYYEIDEADLKEIESVIKEMKACRTMEQHPMKPQRLCEWCYFKDKCYLEGLDWKQVKVES